MGAIGAITEEEAVALRALYETICSNVTRAHREGKKAGKNLLAQLASGEISVQDLNKRGL